MERLGKSFLDYFKRADKFLWLVMLAISAYSFLLLKTVPSPAGRRSYFATQLIAILIGYIGAWLITLIDYRDLSNLWYIIAGFCIFLLIYTHFFGIAVQNSGGINARAWISIPGLGTFQPSELVKIGVYPHLFQAFIRIKGPRFIGAPIACSSPGLPRFDSGRGDVPAAGRRRFRRHLFLHVPGDELRGWRAAPLFHRAVCRHWRGLSIRLEIPVGRLPAGPLHDLPASGERPHGQGLTAVAGKNFDRQRAVVGRGLFSPDSRVQKGAASLSNRATISSPWQANSLVLSAAC